MDETKPFRFIRCTATTGGLADPFPLVQKKLAQLRGGRERTQGWVEGCGSGVAVTGSDAGGSGAGVGSAEGVGVGVAGVEGVVSPGSSPALPLVPESFVGVCVAESLFSAVEVPESFWGDFESLEPIALPSVVPVESLLPV